MFEVPSYSDANAVYICSSTVEGREKAKIITGDMTLKQFLEEEATTAEEQEVVQEAHA